MFSLKIAVYSVPCPKLWREMNRAVAGLHDGLAWQQMREVGAGEGHFCARRDLAAGAQLIRAQLVDA